MLLGRRGKVCVYITRLLQMNAKLRRTGFHLSIYFGNIWGLEEVEPYIAFTQFKLQCSVEGQLLPVKG